MRQEIERARRAEEEARKAEEQSQQMEQSLALERSQRENLLQKLRDREALTGQFAA